MNTMATPTTTSRGRPTTLRARLIASGAVAARPGFDSTSLDPDDPFAGDDILWADEDWAPADEESRLRSSYGTMVALVLSAVGWIAVAGSVFLVYGRFA